MSDDEKAIYELQRQWLDATSRGDVEELVSMMTEDVVFLRPGHAPIGREQFLTELIAALHNVEFECEGTFEEVIVSGDLACARARLKVNVRQRFKAEFMTMTGYTLSVFRKFAPGDWLLIRDANMLTPSKDS